MLENGDKVAIGVNLTVIFANINDIGRLFATVW